MQHQKAAVADEGIDVLIGRGELGAEGAADLVAHAGEAVFHVIGVFALRFPQPLHTAGQRTGGADRDRVGRGKVVDNTEGAGLRKAVFQLNAVHPVDLREVTCLRFFMLGRPRALVTVEQRSDRVETGFRVGEDGGRVHLECVERADVDRKDLHVRVLEAPLGAGRKVGQTGADGDHEVRLFGNRVGSSAAGDADAAHVQRVVKGDLALAGLRFADGDIELFGKGEGRAPAFGIGHAAADNHHRLLCGFDQVGCRLRFPVGGQLAVDVPHALLQEIVGIVERFRLDVLRHGDADRAGVGGAGQNAHRIDAGGHQLFGALDAVPVFADGAEGVVRRRGNGVELLDLLQHRVGLAAGEGIAGKDEQRDAVRRRGAAGGDHVQRAGADRRRAGNDLAAVLLLRVGNRGVRHALLVVTLEVGQVVTALFERLADTDHAAVAEDAEDAFDELGFLAVKADVLVVEELDEGLRHGEFHFSSHYFLRLKSWEKAVSC